MLKLNPTLNAVDLQSLVHSSDVHKFHYLNSMLPAHEQYKTMTTSSFKDSFMTFTEEALACILGLDWSAYKDSKGSLISALFGMSIIGYNIQLLKDFMDDGKNNQRYVLKNSIKTDGLDLEFLLIDTTRKAFDLKKKLTKNAGSELPNDFDPKEYTYVGIDGGVTFFAAAAVFRNQGKVSQVRNMSFKMKALTEPSRQHQHYIRQQKVAKLELESPVDIGALEFSLERIDNESWPRYFERTAAARESLETFYNTKTMKIRRRDLKVSLKREYQLALNGLLKMVNTHMVTL